MHRIAHVAASFFTVAVLYWAYAATVVPLVEPQRPSASEDRRTSQAGMEPAAPESKYVALFEALFRPDHWTRNSHPKVIEFSQGTGMVVFQDYETRDDGRVKIKPCVMMYFPTPWPRTAAPPPRDVIVLESPQGALAQLDGPIKFTLDDREPSRLENVWLTGPVYMRSDMEHEGPADDLEIRTSDVLLNDRMISSEAAVALRLGPHTGSGEKLDIRFLPGTPGGGKDFDIGGVQSIQLLRSVRLVLQDDGRLGEASGLAETPSGPGTPIGTGQGGRGTHSDVSRREIELTCHGPLFIDLPAQTAEFENDVAVFIHGDGPSDSLTSDSLTVVFDERQNASGPDHPPTDSQSPGGRAAFEPILFEATGRPVTINSPLRELRGICRKLVYDVRRQHLTLESLSADELAQAWSSLADSTADAPVLQPHELCHLDYGTQTLDAPRIEYTLDPEQPRARLGTLHVAGPGSFTSETEDGEEKQEVHATWRDSLQLIRQGGMPVLSLFGRPEVRVSGVVRIAAKDLHVWLKEEPQSPDSAAPQAGGPPRIEISPDRLLARENVEIDSPQVIARVDQFEAWLVAVRERPGGGEPRGGPNFPGASPATQPWRTVTPAPDAPARSYYVEADNLQLRALLPDRAVAGSTDPQVTHLTLTGSVIFEERTSPEQKTAPVRIEADWINVADAHTEAMTLRALGAAPPPAKELDLAGLAPHRDSAPKLVVANINGTRLRGEEIAFDQRRGRFDVLTPGDLALTIDRDLEGRPVDVPIPVDIRWQGTLSFDGRSAVLTRGVFVRTPQEQLRTERLVASLATPVPLQKLEWNRKAEFDRLECTGGVVIDRQTFDAGGVASREHAEIPDLTIERGVGRLYASGPGWIRSVQRDRGSSLVPGSGRPSVAFGSVGPHSAHQARRPGEVRSAATTRFAPPSADPGLVSLRVDFAREMRGSLDRRQITFVGQVHCVRGPVADWEQPLHVENLPQLPADTVVLDAATLTVHQWKQDAKTWYALEAEGGVEVEGGLPRSGIFTARGARLSYDQSKDLMILDGGGGLANLVLEQSLGGDRQTCQAESVYFWPSRPEVLGNYVHNASGEF